MVWPPSLASKRLFCISAGTTEFSFRQQRCCSSESSTVCSRTGSSLRAHSRRSRSIPTLTLSLQGTSLLHRGLEHGGRFQILMSGGYTTRILRAVPNSRLMMVEGRRKAWTQQLQGRMKANMGDAYDQVIFYPRLPNSDTFMSFISVADVLLHPFPFDGSKTAADGLAMGMPVVTWPSVRAPFAPVAGLTALKPWTLLVLAALREYSSGCAAS